MAKKNKIVEDVSTEQKIRAAASTVFTKKGYAATRTRDIAEEAGINLALLNYYFRSKEKLFELIMMEKLTSFFGTIVPVLNNADLSLDQKIVAVSERYSTMLIEHPDLPLFILGEVRTNPETFANKLPIGKALESHFIKQLQERRPDLHPFHFLMNLLGLAVFPFILKPLLMTTGALNEKAFNAKIGERITLIPKWMSAMLKTK
ncbi:MAG TPA: TetR/AcrR family transcriptional regulator [Chryseolinea sp.]|nr:TetR/AcrR family transcriptional regulator [Chryseolinea sp.]